MKVSDVVDKLPEGSRCLWQITPSELPHDMRPLALELWSLPGGRQTLCLFYIDGKRDGDWYNRVEGYSTFQSDHSS